MTPEKAIETAVNECAAQVPVKCKWIPDHYCTASEQVCEPCLAEKYARKAHDLARVSASMLTVCKKLNDIEATQRKPKGHG
jgi:hypothetical protein